MNTYAFELKALKPWPWFIGISGVIVTVMAMYPAFSKDTTEFLRVIENMPDAFKAVFDMDTMFLSSVLGFFGYALNYIKMIAGVQAMLWGAAVMAKERRFHTADFVFSKPRTRSQILTAKVSAVLTGLIATFIVFAVMSAIMLTVFGDGYSSKDFTLILTGFIGFQIVFFSLGLFVGTVFKKVKNPLGLSLGTVFGTYIAGAISGLGNGNNLRLLSPFEYFSSADVLQNGSYGAGNVILALLIAAFCIAGSYYVFTRQDIK